MSKSPDASDLSEAIYNRDNNPECSEQLIAAIDAYREAEMLRAIMQTACELESKRADEAVEDAANYEMDNHALKKRIEKLEKVFITGKNDSAMKGAYTQAFICQALAELDGGKP